MYLLEESLTDVLLANNENYHFVTFLNGEMKKFVKYSRRDPGVWIRFRYIDYIHTLTHMIITCLAPYRNSGNQCAILLCEHCEPFCLRNNKPVFLSLRLNKIIRYNARVNLRRLYE